MTPVGMEVCGVILTPVGVKTCGVPCSLGRYPCHWDPHGFVAATVPSLARKNPEILGATWSPTAALWSGQLVGGVTCWFELLMCLPCFLCPAPHRAVVLFALC